MKSPIEASSGRLAGIVAICGALLCLIACGTVQSHRARQFADHFASLDAATRARVESATIALGDAPTTVYIALGTPSYFVAGNNEGEAIWVYWGRRWPDAEGQPSMPDQVRFATRSELHAPASGKPRVALRIHFEHSNVAAMDFTPITLSEPGASPPLEMGEHPPLP